MLWILAGNLTEPRAAGLESPVVGRLVVRTSTPVLPVGIGGTRISWMSQPVTSLPTSAMGTVHTAATSLKINLLKDVGEGGTVAEVPVPVGMTRMKGGIPSPKLPKNALVAGS